MYVAVPEGQDVEDVAAGVDADVVLSVGDDSEKGEDEQEVRSNDMQGREGGDAAAGGGGGIASE